MNVHNLKIRPNYFKDVIAEVKNLKLDLMTEVLKLVI